MHQAFAPDGKAEFRKPRGCALLPMDCSTPSPAMRLFSSTLGVANAGGYRAIAEVKWTSRGVFS